MTEKRNVDDNSFSVRNIIIELEDVCVQNDFEKETIFPFVRQHIKEYIEKNWVDKSFQDLVQVLREKAKLDEKQSEGFILIPEGENDDAKEALLKNIIWQMDNNKTTESFNKMRKQICEVGYSSGTLKYKLNDHIDTCFKTWIGQGMKLLTISSYNIEDQKLLLANTDKGDLLPLIFDHFDGVIGPKTKVETFSKIVEKLKCSASDVMFISSNVESALAASVCGLVTLLISKLGTTELPTTINNTDVIIVTSISDIEIESSAKKRRMSNECEDITASNTNREPCKSNISVESDVEMIDVSESGVAKLSQNGLETLDNGRGDNNSVDIKSDEKIINSNNIEYGGGDAARIDTSEVCVNGKIDECEDNVPMETESSFVKDYTNNEEDHIKCNGKKDPEVFIDNDVCCSNLDETPSKTEEIKTDMNINNLDKDGVNLEIDVPLDLKNEVENKTENILSNEGKTEGIVLSEQEEVDKPSTENDILKQEIGEGKEQCSLNNVDHTNIDADTDKIVLDKPIEEDCVDKLSSLKHNTENIINSDTGNKQIEDQLPSCEINTVNIDECTAKNDFVETEDNNSNDITISTAVDKQSSCEINTANMLTESDQPSTNINDKQVNMDSSEINTPNLEAASKISESDKDKPIDIVEDKEADVENSLPPSVDIAKTDIAESEVSVHNIEDKQLDEKISGINTSNLEEAAIKISESVKDKPIDIVEDKEADVENSLPPSVDIAKTDIAELDISLHNIEDKQLDEKPSEINTSILNVNSANTDCDKQVDDKEDEQNSFNIKTVNVDVDMANTNCDMDTKLEQSVLLDANMDVVVAKLESNNTADKVEDKQLEVCPASDINMEVDVVETEKPSDENNINLPEPSSLTEKITTNSNEGQTATLESVNGISGIETIQNGTIANGELEVLDENKKENLPSLEKKPVVDNNLTDGTEIEV